MASPPRGGRLRIYSEHGARWHAHDETDITAEEIPVDAYSSYIMQLSEARTSELRREAAEYALSRAAPRRRISMLARFRARLHRRARPLTEPMPLPALVSDENDLRRSA